MPKVSSFISALCLTAVVATAGLVSTAPTVTEASAAPWTTPTVPPNCTTAQKDSGNVAGCIVHLGVGLPETRGWPMPPFPEATLGAVIPWVDLARGATGQVVARVQEALNANAASSPALVVDGQFGALTEAAVRSFQTARSMPSTGIVNEATATALNVQNRAAGAFPPAGWTWLGWGYNGSPALAQWEQLLTRNSKPVGSIPANQLRGFADALPLYEGFLAEIQAGGYVITGGAGGYVFRCTASSNKSCEGQPRARLSNHSYGLAVDFNTVKNPLKTYYGINGQSACKTPMETDIPQWVVQVAEKWGLYWGGYGWSSGCTSPSQVKTSASRDPMHFEFNGTVEQARAILAFNRGGGPGACFPVADSAGNIAERCHFRNELPAAHTRVVVTTNAPAGATAALVNIATTSAHSGAFVTAESCAAAGPDRLWANGTTRSGRAVASLAVVALDAQGRFCVYQSAPMHTIVDVQGFFAPAASAPNGTLYTPISSTRVTDTRHEPFCTPEGVCFTTGPVAASTELVHTAASPVAAVATVANLAVTAPSARGFVTADSCASLVPGPQTRSSLNFAAGDTVANLNVIPSAATGEGAQFCTMGSTSLQQIVDVQGFFAPHAQGGLGFTPLPPSRPLDTRQCWRDPITSVERCGLINEAGSVVRLQAPPGASAVVVSLVSVAPVSGGYVTADSCATLVPGPQARSSLNAAVGAAVSNLAIVPVAEDGTYCVYNSATMHLVVDLLGTFSPAGTLRYLPVTPVRVHDSRPPA